MTAPQERPAAGEVTEDERPPMSEAERSIRIEVLWGRVEHLEGLLGSIVGSLEGLLGDRPKRDLRAAIERERARSGGEA